MKSQKSGVGRGRAAGRLAHFPRARPKLPKLDRTGKALLVAVVALLVVAGFTFLPLPLGSGSVPSAVNVPSLQGRISYLQGQLGRNVSEVRSLTSQVSSLQAQLTTTDGRITSLQSQVASDEATIANLQSQLSDANGQLTDLNSEIASLQAEIVSDSSQIALLQTLVQSDQGKIQSLQATVSSDATQINTLEAQVSNLQAVAGLQVNSTLWSGVPVTVGPSSCNDTTWTGRTPYAGFVTIDVLSSTLPSASVSTSWSYHGINYNTEVSVGSAGSVSFPVLPASSVVTGVCNTDVIGTAVMKVTVTYTS